MFLIVLHRGGGMSFFPVKHEKFPLSYIQNAKNFSSKPLNSGEAVDSPASPVPPPLGLQITDTQIKLGIYSNLIGNYFAKPPVIIKNPENNTSNV